MPSKQGTQSPQHPVTTAPSHDTAVCRQDNIERGPCPRPVQRGLAGNLLCIAAILEKHPGFASAKRDADWTKPALILIIKLDDIVFMELNFLMTKKLSVLPNKDKRSSEPAQEAISATNTPHGLLIAPWDGVIGRAGT